MYGSDHRCEGRSRAPADSCILQAPEGQNLSGHSARAGLLLIWLWVLFCTCVHAALYAYHATVKLWQRVYLSALCYLLQRE